MKPFNKTTHELLETTLVKSLNELNRFLDKDLKERESADYQSGKIAANGIQGVSKARQGETANEAMQQGAIRLQRRLTA
jgi:hypothetical protein